MTLKQTFLFWFHIEKVDFRANFLYYKESSVKQKKQRFSVRSDMKALLLNLQNRPTQQRENRHRPVTPEQVAEYTNIPLATIYQKLANREIPGSKPGKWWVIYLDEIDKWLEANRKNPIPLTDEEQNAAILASHKRKPNKSSWNDEGSAQRSQPIAKPFDGDKI